MAEVSNEEAKNTNVPEKLTIDALQYKPNIDNMMDGQGEDQSDSEGGPAGSDDSSNSEEEEDQKAGKKQVFKAAKMNPVLYEDKETKKQRREELFQKKKASRSDYVNELRREVYDLPEEVHLGGMASQKSRYSKEQDQIEKIELENFKRMNFNKKEVKEMRSRAKGEVQDRLDKFDDMKGLDDILGTKRYNNTSE